MSAVRRAARPIGRPIRRFAIGRRTKAWPQYSRLFVAGDGEEWAITDDARQIARLAATLGAQVGDERWISAVRGQSIFYASQFSLADSELERENRLGLAYLHGRPGTPGMPEFDTCYELVRRRHERDRPDPGPVQGDGGARARRRRPAREGVSHPDRHRPRPLPAAHRRGPDGGASGVSGCPRTRSSPALCRRTASAGETGSSRS